MRQKLLLASLALLLFPKPNSGQSTLQSHTYRFEDLTSQKEANATFRPILDGMTRNGVHLHVHEVFLLPGSSPQSSTATRTCPTSIRKKECSTSTPAPAGRGVLSCR